MMENIEGARGAGDDAAGSYHESTCPSVNLAAGSAGAGHHPAPPAAHPAGVSALGNLGGDGSAGRTTAPQRIKPGTVELLIRLKRDLYADFSVRHFYEHVTEKPQVKVSYNWLRMMLQEAGVVEKEPARGKYRRGRERRPMVGMLVHLDASSHEWIVGLPRQDLVVALDDADGRILYGRFFAQEGTASTLAARDGVLRRYGRFPELYTGRGSHFCRTAQAGQGPAEEQNGQVAQALHALGIRQILARSPAGLRPQRARIRHHPGGQEAPRPGTEAQVRCEPGFRPRECRAHL
jgi:hypothetical protein